MIKIFVVATVFFIIGFLGGFGVHFFLSNSIVTTSNQYSQEDQKIIEELGIQTDDENLIRILVETYKEGNEHANEITNEQLQEFTRGQLDSSASSASVPQPFGTPRNINITFNCGHLDSDRDDKVSAAEGNTLIYMLGFKCLLTTPRSNSLSTCGPRDVNRNGVIDLEDIDLASFFYNDCKALAPVVPAYNECNPADADKDGKLNSNFIDGEDDDDNSPDFLNIRKDFGKTCYTTAHAGVLDRRHTSPGVCGSTDINLDGVVNLNDFTTYSSIVNNPSLKDKSCSEQLLSVPRYCLPFDRNSSGFVDFADLRNFFLQFGKKCEVNPNLNYGACGSVDINGDGVVNIGDFTIMQRQMHKSCSVFSTYKK